MRSLKLRLWPDVSNNMLNFSLEFNHAWLLAYTLNFTNPRKKKSQGVRSQNLGGHFLLPCKDITCSRNFSWSDASFHMRCGRSLHPAETRSCQSPILPSSARTEWISCLTTVLHLTVTAVPLSVSKKNNLITHLSRNHTTQSFSIDAFHAFALFEGFHFSEFDNFVC